MIQGLAINVFVLNASYGINVFELENQRRLAQVIIFDTLGIEKSCPHMSNV